ncbi:MAG: hypothetical protein ACRC10_01770 [Thermoguttaceae bacterium]
MSTIEILGITTSRSLEELWAIRERLQEEVKDLTTEEFCVRLRRESGKFRAELEKQRNNPGLVIID